MKERTKLLLIAGVFLAAYFVPFEHARMQSAILEAFAMLQDYARQHVLLCLVPALFIAGAMSLFVSKAAVLKYFGAGANKLLSYSVASVSGTVLAVCSCTVLPLFAGIYKRGAGIGPATTFLYAGPAINVLAIILTARVLGFEMGVARAVGAIGFSIVIGLIMAFIYRHEEKAKIAGAVTFMPEAGPEPRRLWQTALYFLTMVLILIFATWGKPALPVGFWNAVYAIHWPVTIAMLGVLAYIILRWFSRDELSSWVDATWGFTKQILPLLFAGVLAAGFLMGRPGQDNGLIPSRFVAALVGGNSLWANLFASVAGAFMYFATLTEIPILQGLMGAGMGKGPGLALLLAGPALSLPSMLVLRSIMGTQKTVVYTLLVIIMAAASGMIYGAFF